jgi:mono/diheme cytochrome c family protein
MRFVIFFLTLAGALGATEPNLPRQAPAQWAARTNPMAGDSRAEKAGAKLFERECAECHGASAGGNGKAPSLRQAGVSRAKPGALFWIIENGAIYHGMPSFAHLPEPQRWQIVTFLQSLNTQFPEDPPGHIPHP